MDITNDIVVAYARGNVSDSEREAVRQYLRNHPDQLEVVMTMIDEDYDIQLEDNTENHSPRSFNEALDDLLNELDSVETDTSDTSTTTPPLLSKAAQDFADNLCAVRCEGYALRTLGVDVSDEVLEHEAQERKWLKPEGMPLHSIGLLSGLFGSYITRRYYCTLDNISQAIRDGKIAITVIDNSELGLSPREARQQDLRSGQNPNHAIIVSSLNQKKNTIDIFEPGISDMPKTYPLDIFVEAWNDSANYLVTISNHTAYDPQPLDLSDVKLERELTELREAIAENAHEVWARERKKEGWTYGPKRDDEKKLHPDMLPYHLLPESEKEYDRQMAINTIKLVKKLGWELVKKNPKH